MKKFLISLGLGLILSMLVSAFCAGAYLYDLFREPISANTSGKFTVFIPLGTPFRQVIEQLKEKELIRYPGFFRHLARYLNVASQIRAGEFELLPHWNTWQLFQHLTSGKSIVHKVTIPEGWNYEVISRRFESRGLGDHAVFMSLFRDPRLIMSTGVPEAESLEGFLFPETYFFSKIENERQILEKMISHYRKAFGDGFQQRALELGHSEYEILILASIIEKETGTPVDRPMIASVFHNRLKRRMRLYSDPTVIYGLKEFNGNLTRKDLRTKSPFNTYLSHGLPPTPICSPGRDALHSALYPAEGSYLYFVARGDGSSQFSRSLREHNKAVDHYQKNRKIRKMMRKKRLQEQSSKKL